MTQWKDKLTPSEASFMQEIVDQVPEMVRGVYVDILEKLAEGTAAPGTPKFRYFVACEGDVEGTNDVEVARRWATYEDYCVIDSQDNLWLIGSDGEDDSEIMEIK